MKIDIWSDIACPFCYMGETQLQQALDQFAHKREVEIVYHSYQLDSTAPKGDGGSVDVMLAKKRGMTVQQAHEMNQAVATQAKQVGLDYHMDAIKVTNTHDAHRLLHLAQSHGLQDVVRTRLFKAYFTDGLLISDATVLTELAVEAGLPGTEVTALLAGDDLTAEVAHDISLAQQLGIQGVPFFIIDEQYGISGAQGAAAFTEILQKVWHETHPLKMVGVSDASVCVDGVCDPSKQ